MTVTQIGGRARTRVLPALSLAAMLLAACDSTPRATSAAKPAAPAPSATTAATTEAPKPAPQAVVAAPLPAAPDVGIEVSNVTKRGLAGLQVRGESAIATWFNGTNGEGDPFFAHMKAELDRADSGAKSIAELKLSSATEEALTKLNIKSPAEISTIDLAKMERNRVAYDCCRNDVVKGMQRLGWTVLRAEITNQPRATNLSLNGAVFASISPSEKPAWRRFLVKAEGNASDGAIYETLSVDLPDASSGSPPVRWFRDIRLTRGGEVQLSMDVSVAPIPSIGIAAANPLSPAAVYAGDTVTLTAEGAGADTIWFAFASARELDSSNYNTTPSANATSVGLPSWFRLRRASESNAGPRMSVLDEPALQPIAIGRGATIAWTPQVETPSARIGVLVRGASGYWGFAERSIAVADLRPGVWIMPNLALDPASMEAAQRSAGSVKPTPGNIYDTFSTLANLIYLAQSGKEASFDLRVDEYRDASLPIAGATIDFGDGTTAVDVAAADVLDAQVTHTFASAGMYQVKVRTKDAMGFERTHTTNVSVSAEAPAPAPAAPTIATSTPSVRQRITVTEAESSVDLFMRAASDFGTQVAAAAERVTSGKKVGIANIHDRKDQTLVDVIDSAIVTALLAEGSEVYEREPVYQHAINARGFVESSTLEVPDQEMSEIVGPSGDRTLKQLVRLAPDVDVVIEYKLKRAGVRVQPAGALMMRTARIFAFVRVHERGSMRILADTTVAVSIGSTIAASESTSAGAPWDSLPDGFMLDSAAADKAIESIEVKTEVVPEPAAATQPVAPAVPAIPAVPDTGLGGKIKGLFGG